MTGNLLRVGIWRLERCVAVRVGRLHDRDDLLRSDVQVGHPDPIGGLGDHEWFAIRGQLGAVVDVVHALQPDGLRGVHLKDHLVGLVDPRLVVADRGGGNQLAIRGDPGHLDHGDIHVPEEALPHHLRHVGQMDVRVIHQPGVDLLAADRVGLVRHAQVDAVDLRHRTVELGCSRGAGPDADGITLSGGLRRPRASHHRPRDHLRIARTGEPAHPDIRTRRDERGGLLCRHDLVSESLDPVVRLLCHT